MARAERVERDHRASATAERQCRRQPDHALADDGDVTAIGRGRHGAGSYQGGLIDRASVGFARSGGVAERSKALVLKTSSGGNLARGFESLPRRSAPAREPLEPRAGGWRTDQFTCRNVSFWPLTT